MATVTFLGAAEVFTVDSVDLADQLSSITMNKTVDALESTSLKDASRTYVAGLENSETTFTVMGSFVHRRSDSVNLRRRWLIRDHRLRAIDRSTRRQ
jgi:hypothetical protein